MAWSVIRRATDADRQRLQETEQRFMARHGLTEMEMGNVVNNSATYPYDHRPAELRRLHHLYLRCVRRALQHPWAAGICYGTVGFDVD